jgi:multimeric flavodoxin WrbA
MKGFSKKISVLGICGSPRDGNSLFLLGEAIDAAIKVNSTYVEAMQYNFKGKKFSPCFACFKCAKEKSLGECVIADDFQELRDQWLKSQVIIYSVPVYHLGVPGQLKCFIDRLGNTVNRYCRLTSPRFLKVVGAIAQGMDFAAGQEMTINFLIQHAMIKNCVPISGDGWQSYLGAGGWTMNERGKDAIKKQFEKKILDAEVAVNASRSLGKRAVELAFILQEGGIVLRDFLSNDPVYNPFLKIIRLGKKGD